MKKIGITGGIGSGKSLVAKILETMHFPVFYADQVAKEIINAHPKVREQLIEWFGEEMYNEKQELNKTLLASHIFTNESDRLRVNKLVHPLVGEAFHNWAKNQKSNLVFQEAAILFETGSFKNFDATILVIAPKALKVQRVMQRDNLSEHEVLDRMSKQWTDEAKVPLADFILSNDERHPVLKPLEDIITQLLMN